MKQRNISKGLIGLLVLTLSAATPIFAHSIWSDYHDGHSFSWEIIKPNCASPYYHGWASFINARFAAGNNSFIKVELPYAMASQGDRLWGGSEMSLGNPYLGLEIGGRNSGVAGEFGLRIPLPALKNYYAGIIGTYADVDRIGAFESDVWTLQAMVNYRKSDPTGFFMRWRGGPVFMAYAHSCSGCDNSDLWGQYGMQIGVDQKEIFLAASFTGIILITESDLNIGERTLHQMAFSIGRTFGSVTPQLNIHIPIDDNMQRTLDNTISLEVTFRP